MNNWRLEEKERIKFYRINPSPGLNLVFTTRNPGVSKGGYRSLNLSYDVGDDPENVNKNYVRVKKALGIDKIFTLKQIHSNKIFYLNSNNFKEELEGDGLFTDEKRLAIGVKVADCLPIYIFDKKYKVIGIAHAGWRSTLAQIGMNLVNAITQKFGLSPSDLNFALGPCIDQPCYEVGFELLSRFFNNLPGSESFFVQHNRRLYLDLKSLNGFLLGKLGLTEIASLDYCTKCNPDFFYSVRRDGISGRNLAVIYFSNK
ncbi:MAG: peptidoglycan editing factor PgeF [candidate division WOR-3 bacterium]|nr:peptidoglycan editing factor PgeF [candidate division WOR-3 bacterium]MDH5682930.1 peptidoglycan editing factor PgeF [candidate division WOR-3 bacterium]